MSVCVCVQVHSTVCVCVVIVCLHSCLDMHSRVRESLVKRGRERGEVGETDVLRQDLRAAHLEIVISVKFKGFKTQRTLF